MTRRRHPAIPPPLRPAVHAAGVVLSGVPDLQGARILAALGGGADSAVMLACLALLAPRRGFALQALHVDHGLSDHGPALAEAAVASAQAFDVPVQQLSVTVRKAGEGLEAAARQVRHDALRAAAMAGGCGLLALGHSATDVAETFLQRLLEGAGRGRSVMRAHAAGVVRPLLTLTRADIRQAAVAAGLPFHDDPMNQDRSLLRTLLRHDVMPLMETHHAQPDRALARAAFLAGQDHDALEAWALSAWSPHGICAQRATLAQLPPAVIQRALRQMIECAAGGRVRTGSEAVQKAAAALRQPGGRLRRYKAGPVWVWVEQFTVRITTEPPRGATDDEEA